MTVVTPQERDAMADLLRIVNGEKPIARKVSTNQSQNSQNLYEELSGPGQVSRREIDAMAQVMQKLQQVSGRPETRDYETQDVVLQEALVTEPLTDGVKIGIYKIKQHHDENRLAGKQHYSVINSTTGDILANELSLYEAAHGMVKLLNAGKYVNSSQVMAILEAEMAYTSNRIDALRFLRASKQAEKQGNIQRKELMETRKHTSLDRAMEAKARVKSICRGII
jgi:hypothetical protein